MITCSK